MHYHSNTYHVQKCGKNLDQPTKQGLLSAVRNMPGIISRKFPLTIRLLELLHTQPEVWMPYRRMCLADRIQTSITMTAEELSDLLKRMPISFSPEENKLLEKCRIDTQKVFNSFLPVLTFLLDLVLPGVTIEPAEITWAFTVVQTRASAGGDRGGKLVPLFDMLNHADSPVCMLLSAPHELDPGALGMLALLVDPTQLSLAAHEPAVLMRRGRRLGRIDDCAVLIAPSSGVRAGAELRLQYHDTSVRDMQADVNFAMTYGFYPAA